MPADVARCGAPTNSPSLPSRSRRLEHRWPASNIAASPGLRLELKTSAANAHPALSGSGFPMAGAAVRVLHSTEDGAHGDGWRGAPSAPTPGPRRRATPPFTLVVTTSWCRTAWPSSPACARATDDVRWLGVGYQIWGPLHVVASLGCRRWCCHSVQDHRAKACNDGAYGCHVPS